LYQFLIDHLHLNPCNTKKEGDIIIEGEREQERERELPGNDVGSHEND